MPIVITNRDTATLAGNLMREGRQVLLSLASHFDGIADNSFVDMGLFPPDAKIAPNAALTQADILAQNREGGSDVLLAIDTSKITVTYAIPVLTPDDTVIALHNGAPATEITDGPLKGAKISPYAPGGSLTGRMIVINRREGSNMVRVAWHPRVFLQADTNGDSQNRETVVFTATVQAFDYTPGTALANYDAQITQYGAIITTTRDQLQAVLDILADEALPTVPAVTPAAPVVTDPVVTEPDPVTP